MIDTLFAFVVLLSVLIFVHELGHFLVAKACGVRVLKFSLGFGPPIGFGRYRLRWQRGHTEYVAAWIPLGGFVKMLGENPDEQDDPQATAHPSETLGAKPLWQKLAIVFAGPAMNLALPVLIFAALQAVGMPRADGVVGLVEVASPAEAAGLRAGDRITALDGEPVRWWTDAAGTLRDSPGRTVVVGYERDGRAAQASLEVVAREGLDEFGGVAQVGWTGLGHSRPSALVGSLAPDSRAALAGLRAGDRVTELGGVAVEDWYELAAAYAGAQEPVVLSVERGVDSPRELTLELPALESLEALGLRRASALVADVMPDTPAASAGLEAGDLILEYDGAPVRDFGAFAEAVATSEGATRSLVFARSGETHEVEITAELVTTDAGLGIEETRYRLGIRGSETLVVGAVALDQVRNPLVSVPRAVGMTVETTQLFVVGLGKLITGEVSSSNLAGPIGIAQIAGNAYQRGWEPYLRIMVLISINLGILNLLPIPVLDGGQATLFIVEGFKRSPLSLRTKLAVQQLGITMLMLLMGLAFWNDLSRLWSTMVDWLPKGL